MLLVTMPRFDRLITLYVYMPLLRLMGSTRGQCVPILSYHSISNNLFGQSHPYYQINTTPEVFSRQMRWLKSQGYQAIYLSDMLADLCSGQDTSRRVVITFDDGYRDFLTEGFAVMKQCGFTATVFLVSDRIRKTPMRYEGVDYLTWGDVRELHEEGIQFGSHTVTHPDLRSLEPDQIDYELGYSKEIIEQELGAGVESFSYPFSFPEEDRDFARFIGDTLENQGFKNGVSSIIGRVGPDSKRFSLPRLPVNSWDTSELLQAKLLGGYDWMHVPQLLKKSVLHNVTLMESEAHVDSRGAG
jgi:peptidoglycan/xylan/chitin deacetylase (PgdA/CDA1 family)